VICVHWLCWGLTSTGKGEIGFATLIICMVHQVHLILFTMHLLFQQIWHPYRFWLSVGSTTVHAGWPEGNSLHAEHLLCVLLVTVGTQSDIQSQHQVGRALILPTNAAVELYPTLAESVTCFCTPQQPKAAGV
jgi:hypothetical protein